MKSLIVFLSGLAVTLAGAFIRSCTDALPPEFARSWCGNAPPSDLLASSHAHCAGCVLIAGGLVLVAIAPMFTRLTGRSVRVESSQT